MDSDNTMASALKRKRVPVEEPEAPKRVKSVKSKSDNVLGMIANNTGWEAAFNPATQKTTQANGVNGVNGHKEELGQQITDTPESAPKKSRRRGKKSKGQATPKIEGKNTLKDGHQPRTGLASPEAQDYADFVAHARPGEANTNKKSLTTLETSHKVAAEKALAKTAKKRETASWKLSEPIGGRIINVDPVFSVDERFLIVANTGSILVYSTATSLLRRSIKLQLTANPQSPPRIITYCLSPTQAHILWTACSDGSIFSVDWTTGSGSDQFWGISSTGCIHMTVASMLSARRRRDVVFTTELRKDGGFRITANELAPPNSPIKTVARTIFSTPQRIQFLKAGNQGVVLSGASDNRILLGLLKSTEYDTVDKIRYDFRVFESRDAIKSLDLRTYERPSDHPLAKVDQVKKNPTPVVDLVVGDVRGVVFVYDDLLAKLIHSSKDSAPASGISIVPRKLHWHRQAVNTAKWSLDGNYIITGGTETVLVLWQLDTGRKNFLPHLGATIQNLVVSPNGSSYAIQLADNSVMVMSTAELMPTTNISGIQSSVVIAEDSLQLEVQRVEEPSWERPLVQRTPAVINPAQPSRLLLCVGQAQEIRSTNPLIMSNPFLQTFDLRNSHNLSRQALTRTNVTNTNAGPSGNRLTEPRVTHMRISHDGEWLATVDEWMPSKLDLDFLTTRPENLAVEQEHHREVFLKFWRWNQEDQAWDLVTRIDSPHAVGMVSNDAGRILDLSADPSSLRFSTIGEDGVARTWSSKTRKRDGIIACGKNGLSLRSWNCDYAVPLGKSELLDQVHIGNDYPKSGCVAFSEDGSVLAAAIENTEDILHLIDPDSGTIRTSHAGLYEGDLVRLDLLGPDLIVLSNKLVIYDVVSEEIKFGITLNPKLGSLSTRQKQEMMHLAVDRKSRTFAIALPNIHNPNQLPQKQSLLTNFNSELTVFHQGTREPAICSSFPTIITALLPDPSSEGYITLDTAAEIRTVLPKGTQGLTALAQSTSALNLDASDDEPVAGLMQLVDEVEEILDEQLPTPAPTADGNDDEDDNETPVVSQQQLAEVFDIGPAFAMPSMEELFFRVAGLFASKPLVGGVV